MKKTAIVITILCAITSLSMAQKPHYLPGDGVYIVGIPANLTVEADHPVMVTEAYQAKFKTTGAQLAAITTDASKNISSRINEEGTLDLVSFMGVGKAYNLIVRNYNGDSYTIGDYAPNKTWDKVTLAAAASYPNGNKACSLGVYDHWDCPVSYDEDEMITVNGMDAVTVDFGNPHEGLICSCINFNLVSREDNLHGIVDNMNVTIYAWDDTHTEVINDQTMSLRDADITKVKDLGNGLFLHSVYVGFGGLVDCSFDITISGFSTTGSAVWLPRAIDTHNLYPTHTTYSNGDQKETVANVDACVNIEGYFNYIGTWGWYDGKCEYGEVVAAGDYVQVYIDPTDPDWEGEFFTGDPTFPIESTFGIYDIRLEEKPDWINDVQVDDSQWEQYEALLIIMQANPLPNGETGRSGKVVVTTSDGASKYTIYIRQGDAPLPNGIAAPTITLPEEGGYFDLSGRCISRPQPGQIFIHNGKKYINR